METSVCRRIQQRSRILTRTVRKNIVLNHEDIGSDNDLRRLQLELKKEKATDQHLKSVRFHPAPLEWSPDVAFQHSDISEDDCIEYVNARVETENRDFQDSLDSIRQTSLNFGSKYLHDGNTKLNESWVH